MNHQQRNSVNPEEIPQSPPLEEPSLPDSYEPIPDETPEPEPFPKKDSNEPGHDR